MTPDSEFPKVLLDCTRVRSGGGIQVCLSLLQNAAEDPGPWHAVLSPEVAREAPEDLANSFASCSTIDAGSVAREAIAAVAGLRALEEKSRPDLVFTVFGPTLWRPRTPHLIGFALPRLIYPEIQVRRTVRDSLASAWKRVRISRSADWVVETQTVRARMSKHLHVPADRIHVIPNAPSPSFSRSSPSPILLPGAHRRWRIAVPSAYYRHKNLEVIPEVSAALTKSGHGDHAFFLTIPTAPWERLRKAAHRLNCLDTVMNLGPVPHAQFRGLYEACNLVFLPTLLECSTAVYPESFATGTPLVTSDLDFARELCGNSALFANPLDPSSCARALARLMDSAELRDELVASGRRATQEAYPSPAAKWLMQRDLIRSLASRPKAQRD